AGGIGTRFWPVSRTQFPKQFHDILGRGKSLVQETFDRFASYIPKENIYIVTNERYNDLVKEQLPELRQDQILLEPIGRNTAPCVAYAAYKIHTENPDATLVVAPADHLIQDEDMFKEDILLAMNTAAKKEVIVTLGITPSRPDTGYGYIQYLKGENGSGYYKVKTFTEKPNLELAKSFLASGDFLWNSGIFIFSTQTIINAFSSFLPEIAEPFSEISSVYYTDKEGEAIKQLYGTCKNISIDYGIMEKAQNVYVIPSSFSWSDLGTWSSVHAHTEQDEEGNAAPDQTVFYDCKDNVIRVSKKDKVVVLDGLEGFIVVDTDDALLICRKENEQFIKQIVGDMRTKYGETFV
ncbi:MAG: mannose-1-phosphate guanylyltransferase, partial [Bacteroidota bacterium]